MLHWAERVPQLDIDVHRARAWRHRLSVGCVDSCESHSGRDSTAWRRQVECPAGVPPKKLDLLHHSLHQSWSDIASIVKTA